MKYPYYSLPPVNKVYFDKSVKHTDFFCAIFANMQQYPEYKNTAWIETDDYRSILAEGALMSSEEGKKTILIYPEKGQFMHACPGSDGVVCCRYFVLDFGMNCPYDCHYCYLQTYAKFPFLTLAGNIGQLLNQLQLKIESAENIHWRIGTGEYMDSLALENITGMGKMLVEFFSKLDNATLELKTKSIEIDSLVHLNHRGRTVISWSLNPEYITDRLEIHCSSLDDRLCAARKIIDAGYHVGFHLDPVIFYESWEKDYLQLIDRIFDEIPARSIRWISMGTFRYSPGLKEKLRIKYPGEFITRAEMLLHKDNKFRYLSSVRGNMYKKIFDYILQKEPSMMVYLCMETQDAWKRLNPGKVMKPNVLDAAFENRRNYCT